jgi:EAL and modified HD-GYP domain-containing signal transduction protein
LSGAAAAPAANRADVRVARQPILDRFTRQIGYELLFRAPHADSAHVLDHVRATSAVIVDGLLDVGLGKIVGDQPAFVNVSREFLLSMRPMPLPPSQVVLELLEDQSADEELLGVLRDLVDDGFTIALDDFCLTSETETLLEYARIVKIDVIEHTGDALVDLVQRLGKRSGLRLLAEKVETQEDFDRCRKLGFDAFQGYFFARPARIDGWRVPSHRLAALSAMSDLSATHEVEALHRVISRDAGLSMRLLRFANSAAVSPPRRVASVREGLVWLGATAVRRLALMVAMASVNGTPDELLVTALIRARMCQLLSDSGDGPAGDTAFTVGLFSVADALANEPMDEVVRRLGLNDELSGALLDGSGELGGLLAGVMAYQCGDFAAAAPLIAKRPDVDQAYLDAVAWADLSMSELG